MRRPLLKTVIAAGAVFVALAASTVATAGSGTTSAPDDESTAVGGEYEAWLTAARAPWLAVDYVLAQADASGQPYSRVDPAIDPPRVIHEGELLAMVDRGRAVLLVRVGHAPSAQGLTLVGAHIDTPAPRVVDGSLSPSPGGPATILATAYGGYKPFLWEGVPLQLVGLVARKGGDLVEVSLGADDGYVMTSRSLDTSPSTPPDATAKNARSSGPMEVMVAANGTVGGASSSEAFTDALEDKYGLTPRDLDAAEMYLVPAAPARDAGLDRQLVGSHGQDDRACSFAAWTSLLQMGSKTPPPRTSIAMLVDREEIGSDGPTGARSSFLELAVAWLLRAQGGSGDDLEVRAALASSRALSADVTPAIDPSFADIYDAQNTGLLGQGVNLVKYTGYDGKQEANDADAEYLAWVIGVLDRAEVPWQVSTLGKVEAGGGGTIAAEWASRGVSVVDIGVPLIGMHSPLELTAKRDIVSLIHACTAFFETP
jgi:aspartyl aminopeptidase